MFSVDVIETKMGNQQASFSAEQIEQYQGYREISVKQRDWLTLLTSP